MSNQAQIIQASIVKSATKAVQETAASPTNQMSVPAVADAQPELTENVAAAVASNPMVQHLTNTEPWYKKRSRWSMIVSFALVAASPVLRHYGVSGLSPETQAWLIDALTTCGNLAAGFLALRAGQALTPMFTKAEPVNPVAYRG